MSKTCSWQLRQTKLNSKETWHKLKLSQGIEARKAERDWMAGIGDIQMQNAIRAQSEKNRNTAIEGAFSSLGTAAKGADDMIDLYKSDKKQKMGDIDYLKSLGLFKPI
jgi:hypothetical protein